MGIAVGLAINTKQNCIVLLPIGLITIALRDYEANIEDIWRRWVHILKKWVIYGAIIFFITLILNPFLWKFPTRAVRAAGEERVNLLGRQIHDYSPGSSGLFLKSLPAQTMTFIVHLFITKPMFAETANYSHQIDPSTEAYMSIPGHNFLRGILAGGCMIILMLFGFMTSLVRMRTMLPTRKQAISILILCTVGLGAAAATQMVLPWQRYIMALIPFVCLWVAYGIDGLFKSTKKSPLDYKGA